MLVAIRNTLMIAAAVKSSLRVLRIAFRQIRRPGSAA